MHFYLKDLPSRDTCIFIIIDTMFYFVIYKKKKTYITFQLLLSSKYPIKLCNYFIFPLLKPQYFAFLTLNHCETQHKS